MAGILRYARLLTARAKSSVPKRKRDILSGAEKEIEGLERQKTERTKAVERASGFKSPLSVQQREAAKKARRLLLGR